MDKTIQLLWVDLTQSKSKQDTIKIYQEVFLVKTLNRKGSKKTNLNTSQADAIVFDYDFPDRGGLQLLLQTKQQYPSIPVIMVTEQHSEDLVLWALHARVWEYMIKPADHQQLIDLNQELLKLRDFRQPPRAERYSFQREIHAPNEARISPENPSNAIIQRTMNYIDNHLSDKITESQLADLCGMSPYRFSRLFKQYSSCTFQEYLLQHRINEAARLLANPQTSITDIAYAVGFNDASYFTRAFKRYKGMSPSDFRIQPDAPTLTDKIVNPSLLSSTCKIN